MAQSHSLVALDRDVIAWAVVREQRHRREIGQRQHVLLLCWRICVGELEWGASNLDHLQACEGGLNGGVGNVSERRAYVRGVRRTFSLVAMPWARRSHAWIGVLVQVEL